jgi:putative hydrolase of the HAD superfamily
LGGSGSFDVLKWKQVKMFDLIAFDADDTLWENEAHYELAREQFRQILAPYSPPANLDDLLDQTENNNIPYFGYGVSSFIFSLIETSIQATARQITAADIQRILDLSRGMLDTKIDLYEQVEPTLQHLSKNHPLMLITKGDLLHQHNKLTRSGLAEFFRYVEVVSDKTREIYADILARHQINPRRFLMVGNSMRSDILPVLELGARAIYIPGKLSWAHEHRDLPESLADHFVELDHLGQVEAWVKANSDKF